MRICLIDTRRAAGLPAEAANYVAQLGPVLAEMHRVQILTVTPGLVGAPGTVMRVRRVLLEDRPEVVHINNLCGVTLALLAFILGEPVAFSPALVLGIHSELLLQQARRLNRRSTQGVQAVVSPSASLLDRYLAVDFFPHARHDVIPYAMPYHVERLGHLYQRALNDRRAGDLHNPAA